MGSSNHKRERGHSPPIAARKSQHGYSGIVKRPGFGQKSRSQSPSRDEPVLRGQAARKGKSSIIVMALARMAFTMERKSLDLVGGAWRTSSDYQCYGRSILYLV